ncbi:MAG: hypothetical protein SVO26_01680 [Chloroflexota bacterium]|nr:hypothetical protein [Chloroflexota bacterium]
MPKKAPVVDYNECHPEKCDKGVCVAALACEYGSLVQEEPYEMPELNPAKWCHSCAKCVTACPLKAIKMM